MIDAKTLAYDFDEELRGFEEPSGKTHGAGSTTGRALGLALVGFGLLATLALGFGAPLAGSWTGLALTLLPLMLGGIITFWAEHAGTVAGIRHDGIAFDSLTSRGRLGWIAGLAMTAFYVLIYWFPQYLGSVTDGNYNTVREHSTGLVRLVDPLSKALSGGAASHWFLYGVLYTGSILVFGVRMAMKYRHNRYHLIRTTSVFFSQLGFAFLLPNVLVYFQKPYMEFNGAWPLKYDYLWPTKIGEFWNEPSGIGTFLLFWTVVLSLVATPILTYFFGKRWYCSWVCGCGGLAETVGDPFRQLSDKSTRAWKIERWMIYSVLVLVVLTSIGMWGNHLLGGALFGGWTYKLKSFYGFFIGAVFSGVVGVGFYPLLGNRVWCRFGCPQAALLGLIQRFFSRFRITTNGGQCISCGNCSTYCEMGIDVRAYAERGENIVRASCVGCGVCAAVCPRGVLRLENGVTHVDRYEGADQPLQALRDCLQHEPDRTHLGL